MLKEEEEEEEEEYEHGRDDDGDVSLILLFGREKRNKNGKREDDEREIYAITARHAEETVGLRISVRCDGLESDRWER